MTKIKYEKIPSEAEGKINYNSRRCRFIAAVVLVLVSVLIIILCSLAIKNTNQRAQSDEQEELNLTELKKCTITFQAPKVQSEWNTKPIWFPGYPTSLKESTHSNIIHQLTGLAHGGKNYYSSSSSFKKCFGTTETATCSNIHPLVEMARGPEEKSEVFYPEYVMAIRNPMTAMPAFINQKQIKYHGETGQMSEEAWRRMRDEWINNMIKEWQAFFREWKKGPSLKTGMYLVHEDLHNIDEGPKALKRLRDILHAAGFVVAPEVDIPCIWFNTIGEDELQQHHKNNYEYNDYIPGYTKAHKQLLLTELSILVEEYKEDEELISILQRYIHNVNYHIRIDEIE